MSIFPFTIYCDGLRGGGDYTFRPAFMASRPFNLSCYCWDTVIHSPTRVEFIAFGMLDMCSGGKGEKVFTCEATVDPALTKRVIDRQIMHAAMLRREEEISKAEAEIIKRHADAIRAELGLAA